MSGLYILDFYDSEAIMSASSNSVIEANFLGLTTSLSFVNLFMIYVPSKEETFSKSTEMPLITLERLSVK